MLNWGECLQVCKNCLQICCGHVAVKEPRHCGIQRSSSNASTPDHLQESFLTVTNPRSVRCQIRACGNLFAMAKHSSTGKFQSFNIAIGICWSVARLATSHSDEVLSSFDLFRGVCELQ